MKSRTKLAALGLAGVLAAAPVLNAAHAAGTATPATSDDTTMQASAATPAEERQVLKTSEDLFNALREVNAARIAIFNGDTDQAKSMTDNAVNDLKTAQADAKNLSVPTNMTEGSGDVYMPFDTSITLAEGFQPTDEKVAKINEANQHIANGDQKQAVETLKLANIDVVVKAALLPVNVSFDHATDAAKLISDGSYYEANLALKAIEDSVVLDSYGVSTIPAQGAAG